MISKGSKAKGLMLLSRTRRALGELPMSTYKDVYQEIAEIADPADYDSMTAILGHKHKSPFEKFITRGKFGSPMPFYDWYKRGPVDTLGWDRNRLLDGKASWYIRNNNLEAAGQTLARIPDTFWKKEPYTNFIGGNPFYLDIYRQGVYFGKRMIFHNKRTIIEKMLELESLANTIPSKRAESHFQLANAWYNMTWFGNNWLMVKPWWSMYELKYFDKDIEKTPFNDYYYGCDRAMELYLHAMRETRDKKLATLCCFMAGQCDNHRKEYIWHLAHQRDPNRNQMTKGFLPGKNPYLQDFRQKGVEDRYYRELVKECAVYADYIRTFDKAL